MADLTLSSVEILRAEIIRKRDMKIDAARTQADRALGALNIVADSLFKIEQFDVDEPEVARKAVPTATLVTEIIANLNGSIISQPVVYEKLMELHAKDFLTRDASSIKAQVSMILKKLESRGQLTVVQRGTGPEPTEYRKGRSFSNE